MRKVYVILTDDVEGHEGVEFVGIVESFDDILPFVQRENRLCLALEKGGTKIIITLLGTKVTDKWGTYYPIYVIVEKKDGKVCTWATTMYAVEYDLENSKKILKE